MIGQHLTGRYHILEHLGEGGAGCVYKALDTTSNSHVAVKVLTEQSPDESAKLRFRREFHTLARLKHPRIVQVHNFHTEGNTRFYSMELLDGTDLGAVTPMAASQACSVLRDVASVLAFLHTQRLIHRDLSARNVRITSDGRAKLIDFGVLGTVGTSGEVAGTPPAVPPESLRGLPIDHRVDLYGLGALAYLLLTGQHAYPARNLRDLHRVWARPLCPPSSLVDGIPEQLDQLVISLLHADSQSRPNSAAAVMKRLSALGGLAPEIELDCKQGYLQSGALVGREDELTIIQGAIDSAVSGRGSSIVIQAESGTGKTRLLREAGLLGQVAGASVLSIEGHSARGPYSTLRELATVASQTYPILAKSAAASVPLEHLAPILGGHDTVSPEIGRPQVHSALVKWLSRLAADGPLLLIVDELQRCDESSVAVLATVAGSVRESSMVIMTALRTDEPLVATHSVPPLSSRSQCISLGGLTKKAVQELVRTLFGDIVAAERLSRWMHRVAGGIPLHCTELAQHLVDEEILLYQEGTWTLSQRFDEESLPALLQQAMDQRISSLSSGARVLAEVLAVLGGEVSLTQCHELSGNTDEESTFQILDVLVSSGLLIGDAEFFHFHHDGYREALLRGLSPERLQTLNLQIANALNQRGLGSDWDAQIGWHWLHGGDKQQGANYLERAGERLYALQLMADARPLLAAAYSVIDSQNEPRRSLELSRMLLLIGTGIHEETVHEHLIPAITASERYAGLRVARATGAFIGRTPAFLLGIAWATVSRWLTPKPRRGPKPLEAVSIAFAAYACGGSLYSNLHALERIQELIRRMRVLSVLRNRIPYAAFQLTASCEAVVSMNWTEVNKSCADSRRILETDTRSPIDPTDRMNAIALTYTIQGWTFVQNCDPKYREYFDKVRAMQVPLFAIGCETADIIYHRFRGEEVLANQSVDAAESVRLRLGPSWMFENLQIWMSAPAYGFTRDISGLKQRLAELEGIAGNEHRYEMYQHLCCGDLYRETGELERSKNELRSAMEKLPAPSYGQYILSSLAETLLAQGDVKQCLDVASKAVELAYNKDSGQLRWQTRSTRVLALAEAAKGEFKAAKRRLRDALLPVERLHQPVLAGSLHEAIAQIALFENDLPSYEASVVEVRRWFLPTENPVLIARADWLVASRRVTPKQTASSLRGLVSQIAATADSTVDTVVTGKSPASTKTPKLRSLAMTSATHTQAKQRTK